MFSPELGDIMDKICELDDPDYIYHIVWTIFGRLSLYYPCGN